MQIVATDILQGFSDHFHLVWGTSIIALCWKAGRFVTKLENRILNGESTLVKMATNDLPHIHVELQELNANVKAQTTVMSALLTKK